MKKWILKRNKADIVKMSESLNISPIAACVIANRGIGTYKEAYKFLHGEIEDIYDFNLFKDGKKGIEIISDGIDKGKKIAIYGDYDVDGVMSTVILYKAIKECGGDVIYYLPHRQKEGYGLNKEAVIELKNKGIEILLTCDNGIAAIDEIKKAKELEMKVVIIDHHEPSFIENENMERSHIIPAADSVIDPKQKGCTYPFKNLCAGGLAYKFADELYKKRHLNFEKDEFIILAAIATICDIVDLVDENRIIAKVGIDAIKNTKNMGLNALIKETGVYGKDINEYHLGFIIGPCINATGRLESAVKAVELLTQEKEDIVLKLAKELKQLNDERRDLTISAAEQAIEQVETTEIINDKVIVIYMKGIHESIAGIVAGRVKEKFYRPTVVITDSGDFAKGSARSIEGYNIFENLLECKELFEKFGGHAMAAGISLKYENIDKLRIKLNKNCMLKDDDIICPVKIEKQLKFSEITLETAKQLECLSPFGKANPEPIFGSKNIYINKINFVGKEKKIIRFVFIDEDYVEINGVSFNRYDEFKNIILNTYGNEAFNQLLLGDSIDLKLDLVYSIGINRYNSKECLQLNLKDFRLSK